MTELQNVVIARVGAQGDGITEIGGKPVFVPYALAGEHVRIDIDAGRARLLQIEKASPDRVAPECHHFEACGGCSVQHMSEQLYADWKRGNVVAAFKARGLDIAVDALVAPHGFRRRAVFAMRGGIVGFHAAQSHDIVTIENCSVVDPGIVALLPALRELGRALPRRKDDVRATVTLTEAGVDLALSAGDALTLAQRTWLTDFARRQRLARLAVGSDTIFQDRDPQLRFGNAVVSIPPGIFVQAVAEAEQQISQRILEAVGRARSVVDLFAGCGAFTFPLAAKARVSAYDGDKVAISALATAVRGSKGLKPITATVRDLFREPLSPLELNEFEAVVFDPPRLGAEAQAGRIARSKVKTVVAVSCNPATLARDARLLVDGGYTLRSVTPIDQFRYSDHIEAVAVFTR